MKRIIPYVTSPQEKLDIIFRHISISPGQKSIDLGAGDGRIVIEMARRGAEAHGYEIIEKYVRRAKFNVAKAGLMGKAFIHQGDFWEVDLQSFNIVSIYGVAMLMDDLEKKLSQELQPGTIVISNGFPIPGWKILYEEDHIYIYKKG